MESPKPYKRFTLFHGIPRAQELCESRGGRPGLPSLISLRFLWTYSNTQPMESLKPHHRSTLLMKAPKPPLLEFSGQVSRWVSLSRLFPVCGHCLVVADGRANTDTRMMNVVRVRKARSFQLSKPNTRTATAASNRLCV